MVRCPSYPPTSFASKQESTNPYPYNPAHAKSLLKRTAGRVVPDGITTCTDAGTGPTECGKGIAKGAALNFQYLYYNGVVSFVSQIKELQSSWAQAGIKLTLEGKSFGDVISTAATPCTPGKPCPWDIANWGGGWIYAPDYYPTGEEIFATGAASDFGQYSDKTNDANIRLTNTSSSLSSLYTYENYLSQQLPDIWQPQPPGALTEIGKNVCGVLPQNILLHYTAEYWYFCKPAASSKSRRPLRVTDGRSPGPRRASWPGEPSFSGSGAGSRPGVDKDAAKEAQSVAC